MAKYNTLKNEKLLNYLCGIFEEAPERFIDDLGNLNISVKDLDLLIKDPTNSSDWIVSKEDLCSHIGLKFSNRGQLMTEEGETSTEVPKQVNIKKVYASNRDRVLNLDCFWTVYLNEGEIHTECCEDIKLILDVLDKLGVNYECKTEIG